MYALVKADSNSTDKMSDTTMLKVEQMFVP